jgi:hypothetical protein
MAAVFIEIREDDVEIASGWIVAVGGSSLAGWSTVSPL